ncbi:hypothetical protein D043_2633A, partial [Vibrio parahaemolyticus EKP-021]
MRDIEFVH